MFTLRYPFTLQEGRAIAGLPVRDTLGPLTVGLRHADLHYIMDVSGFKTKEEAEKYVPAVWLALTWLLIEKGLARVSSKELQPVAEPDDPEAAAANFRRSVGSDTVPGEQLHGFLNASSPAVIRTDGNYRTITAFPASVLQSVPGQQAQNLLIDSLRATPHPAPLSDEKLLTALELYRAHYSETSARARLLTLTMVLEVLAERRVRPKKATELLSRLGLEIQQRLSQPDLGAEEAIALNSLSRELDYRTRDSIRTAVRDLVESTYQKTDTAQALEASERALEIYDVRSKLVHKGRVEGAELGKSLTDLTEIVKAVLRLRLQAAVNSNA